MQVIKEFQNWILLKFLLEGNLALCQNFAPLRIQFLLYGVCVLGTPLPICYINVWYIIICTCHVVTYANMLLQK